MRKNKIILLSLVLVGLIVVSVGLTFWDTVPSVSKVDTNLFVIENIDPIDRVIIKKPAEIIDCRAFPQGFMINDRFLMDQNLLTVLAAVFQQTRVQRPITGDKAEQIWKHIQTTGSHVKVSAGDQVLASYWAGGDQEKINSYFATDDGSVYLVHLPGYTSYVSGLFELSAADWRSRKIFTNTWRSLLSFTYQDFASSDNDFQINYQDPFFTVSGIQQLDSNHVMNYLQDLVSLKASALIDTTFQGTPWLELTTTDIDPIKNQKLTLYGDASQPTVLGRAADQYFTFRTTSLDPIIKNADYFERK